MTTETTQHPYIGYYEGRRVELYAEGLYQAKEAAIAYFKPPKSKRHMVSVVLAEKSLVLA